MKCYLLMLLLPLFVWVLPGRGFSQSSVVVSGRIVDTNGVAIRGAFITLIEKESGIGLLFFTTGEDGRYRMEIVDSICSNALSLKVAAPGFVKQIKDILLSTRTLDFTLQQQPDELPEVLVKKQSVPLVIKGDTLSFSASAFTIPGDRVIEDVIKRIPGVTVDESGAIRYLGKLINNFYIDGDDLLNGGYTAATKNIPSHVIDRIEVIERNQHIKMLNGVVPSDIPALNITFKDEASLKLITTAKLGLGTSGTTQGELNSMAFTKKYKAFDIFKYNNLRTDASTDIFIPKVMPLGQDLLNTGMTSTPVISKPFYVLNETTQAYANHFLKSKSELTYRVNVSYLNNKENTQGGIDQQYYVSGDTIRFNQQQRLQAGQEAVHVELALGVNTTRRFFSNVLQVDFLRNHADAQTAYDTNFVDAFSKGPATLMANNFHAIWPRSKTAFLEFFSNTIFENKREELSVSPGVFQQDLTNGVRYPLALQTVHRPSLHTDNFVSVKSTHGKWIWNAKAGLAYTADYLASNIYVQKQAAIYQVLNDSFANDLSLQRLKWYIEPGITKEAERSTFQLLVPISYNYFTTRYILTNSSSNKGSLWINPELRWRQKTGKEDVLSVSAQYANQANTVQDLYRGTILQNYQTLTSNNVPLLLYGSSFVNLSYDIKHSRRLLYYNFTATWWGSKRDFIWSYLLANNAIQRSAVYLDNSTSSAAFSASVSKYLYAIKTNLLAKISYQDTRLVQLQNNVPFDTRYQQRVAMMDAGINLSEKIHADFSATANWSRSTISVHPRPVTADNFSLRQKLGITASLPWKMSCNFNAEHFYYSQAPQPRVSYLLAGAWLRYVVGKNLMDMDLIVSNVFDTHRFELLSLEENGISKAGFGLRERTFLLRIGFRF